MLVRHGESEWNAKGLWTGWTDVSLTEKGKSEAKKTATSLRDIKFDLAFTSDLKRANETLSIILEELSLQKIPVHKSFSIKERHYGEYTGKNKWEIKEKVGEEKFKRIRRGWNEPIPQGESFKDVYERVSAHYIVNILPHIKSGKNILFVAHHNSNRALIKLLDQIEDEKISEVEMATGEAWVYRLHTSGKTISKEKRAANAQKGLQ